MKNKAATPEKHNKRFCSLPAVPERVFEATVSFARASIIAKTSSKWVNGTVLKYFFFTNENKDWKGTTAQHQVIRDGFAAWKKLGIGLSFEEVKVREESDIRIGFLKGDGCWSYVGRGIWNIPNEERTMNFGWDISKDPLEFDTVLHEIGHTLGFDHEHQNPNSGIVWNETAVYETLSKPPNSWKKETTYNNIIKKLNPSEVKGSTWDPNSIMHYPFDAGLIDKPEEYRDGLVPAGGLSARDKEFVKFFYPPLKAKDDPKLKLLQSQEITAGNGQQEDFTFTPEYSKKYKIQTFGNLDTLIVLFESSTDEANYLSGDDDSGTDKNASITLRLIKKRKYIIRVRVLFKGNGGSGGIVIS